MKSMHIGIDARIIDGQWGGVQQVIIGLAGALSERDDLDTRYTFFMYSDHTAWLKPYISGHCEIQVVGNATLPKSGPLLGEIRAHLPILRQLLHTAYFFLKPVNQIPHLEDDIAQTGIEVMHFPYQAGRLTTLPNIFHPWDLQHLHLPSLFTRYERKRRDQHRRALCEQATIVSVASEWTRQDVMRHYGIHSDKVSVTPMGSVLSLYPEPGKGTIETVRQQYGLPERFIFFPSKAWPHKNHLRLLEALALLRDRGHLDIPLVLSGPPHAHLHHIQQRIKRLNLGRQVHHLGYVDTLTLQCLYRLAEMLVFPSEFEGWGLPVTEALSVGLPIVCSNVNGLPQQVGDAGILIDPYNTQALADAIELVWTNADLRADLRKKGLARAAMYTWPLTAERFYQQYRDLSG